MSPICLPVSSSVSSLASCCLSRSLFKHKVSCGSHPTFLIHYFYFPRHILDCDGDPLKPEVVESTSYSSVYPASSVLLLGEQDEVIFGSNFYNFWLAEQAGWSKTGQGFTLRVDTCIRLIEGCQVKNLGDDDDL